MKTLGSGIFQLPVQLERESGSFENLVGVQVASVSPGATADISNGYFVGYEWINTSDDSIWKLVDGATGSAQWIEQAAAATASGSIEIFDNYTDLQASSPTSDAYAFVKNASDDTTIGKPYWAAYVYNAVGSTGATADNGWMLVSRADDVVYQSTLNGDLETPSAVGGIPAGTSVDDIRGKSHSELFDDLLFPTVEATISQNENAALSDNKSGTVEVGTLIENVTLTGSFTQGQIQNGDGTNGPALVGAPSNYAFTGSGISGTINVSSTSLSEQITSGVTPNFSSYNAVYGNNTNTVVVTHDAGTGNYFDNKGNVGSNLDGSRGAGTDNASTTVQAARYRYWYDANAGTDGGGANIPTDSTGVRAATDTAFINSTNVSFNMAITSGQKENWFALRGSLTTANITVLYVESSNADVTGTFTANVISVNDANGNPSTYTVFSSIIPGVGYPAAATYAVSATGVDQS
jgi:hypothetical protein